MASLEVSVNFVVSLGEVFLLRQFFLASLEVFLLDSLLPRLEIKTPFAVHNMFYVIIN